MSFRQNNLIQFGDFRFDTENNTLWRNGDLVGVSPKAIEVLAVLIENRGDLVKRDVILDRVWHDTFVEDGNLNHAILTLRKALGDDVIQTVPRRGYRFVAPLNEVVDERHDSIVIERRTSTNTSIEETETITDIIVDRPQLTSGTRKRLGRPLMFLGIAFLLAGAAVLWFAMSGRDVARSAQIASITSIAVLPLHGFSEDSADEELRLRITDALITKLGSLENIVVRPTNSILRFSGKQVDVVEAGRELNVDAIIDGRVQEENGRLRVTLQLIRINDGQQLWSDQFNGRSGEILNLQDVIAERFHSALAIGLREERPQQAVSNEAYEAYLKGRFLWNQRKKDSLYAALEYFERSVQIDPAFALGYTGISDTYHLLQQRNLISTEDAFKKAEPAAQKALEIDPQLPEANVSMGSVAFIRYSRWTEAEKYYRKAIGLNPNFAEPYARLGMLFNAWGRFDEAHEVLKKAEQLDPTSVNNAIYLGANYYYSRQFDRAESQFRRILEFAPGTERAHFFLERIYEIQGNHDLAVEHALKEREVFRPESVDSLRTAFQTGGIKSFWKKQIELLKSESLTMPGLENHIASRYVLLGEFDKANEYVEANLRNLGTMHYYGRADPLFDPIRKTDKFVELMRLYAPQI